MKIEIARYVARRRVKAIHMKTAGPLQSLPIPTWKWEDISMYFIVGFIGVHSGRPARPGPSPKRPVLFEFRVVPGRPMGLALGPRPSP